MLCPITNVYPVNCLGGAKNQSDSTEKSSIQNFQVVSDESELSQKTSSSSNSLTSASSRTVQVSLQLYRLYDFGIEAAFFV